MAATPTAYCMIPVEQYVREANQQRLVIVQIEDPEPMAELDAIAQVPGIDMLFFGPGDFSQGIGHTGERAIRGVVERGGKSPIRPGGTASSPAPWPRSIL